MKKFSFFISMDLCTRLSLGIPNAFTTHECITEDNFSLIGINFPSTPKILI